MKVRIFASGFLTLTLAVLFAGCMSPEERTKQTAEEQTAVAKQRMVYRDAANNFSEGWSKLQKGMTGSQVAELIGPLSISRRLIDDYIKQGSGFKLVGGNYTLVFDGNGLESWTLSH